MKGVLNVDGVVAIFKHGDEADLIATIEVFLSRPMPLPPEDE